MSTSLKFDPTALKENQRGLNDSQAGIAPLEEQLVIQCPACATCFGLERSVVAAVAAPRFHCSKCDHTFGMHEAQSSPRIHRRAANSQSNSAAPRTDGNHGYTPPALRSVGKSPIPNCSAESEVSDSSNMTEGVVAVYRNSAKVERLEGPMADIGPTLEIPKRWDGSMRSAEPRETAPAYPESASSDIKTPRSTPSAVAETEQIAFDFKTTPTAPKVGQDASASATYGSAGPITYGETLEIASFGTVQNSPLWDTSPSDCASTDGSVAYSAPAHSATSPSVVAPVGTSPKRGLSAQPLSTSHIPQSATPETTKIFPPKSFPAKPFPGKPTISKAIVLPIAAFFVALVGMAVALRSDRSLAARFVTSTLPGALQAAPSELYIKNSRFQKMTLDGGEVVRVISGTIVNSSQRNFHDVQLEVAAFNAVGKPLGVARANAAATLAKTKIHSLTADMIEELQKSSNARRLVLKPGDQRDFAIALLGTEYAPSRHFAARIFSAKSF